MIGISNSNAPLNSQSWGGQYSRNYYLNGNKYPEASSYGASYTTGDIIGIAINLNEGTLEFFKNGVSQGLSHTNLKSMGVVYPSITSGSSSGGVNVTANFGDKEFRFPIPKGFQSYGNYPINRFLFRGGEKTYSLKSIDTWYETSMTSNNAPAPLVASASSYYANGSSYAPWRAFSESTNNWYAEKVPQWVQLNFAKGTSVNRVKIKSSTNKSETPKIIDVLGSNDNINFFLIKTFTLDDWTSQTWKEFTFNNSEYSIYRIYVKECFDNGNRVAINQIVFGFKEVSLVELYRLNNENFIKNGQEQLINITEPIPLKNYILQDEVSENSEGLWTTKLDRKPLSISFN